MVAFWTDSQCVLKGWVAGRLEQQHQANKQVDARRPGCCVVAWRHHYHGAKHKTLLHIARTERRRSSTKKQASSQVHVVPLHAIESERQTSPPDEFHAAVSRPTHDEEATQTAEFWRVRTGLRLGRIRENRSRRGSSRRAFWRPRRSQSLVAIVRVGEPAGAVCERQGFARRHMRPVSPALAIRLPPYREFRNLLEPRRNRSPGTNGKRRARRRKNVQPEPRRSDRVRRPRESGPTRDEIAAAFRTARQARRARASRSAARPLFRR